MCIRDRDADYIAEKVAGLRIFDDADGVMNRSVPVSYTHLDVYKRQLFDFV